MRAGGKPRATSVPASVLEKRAAQASGAATLTQTLAPTLTPTLAPTLALALTPTLTPSPSPSPKPNPHPHQATRPAERSRMEAKRNSTDLPDADGSGPRTQKDKQEDMGGAGVYSLPLQAPRRLLWLNPP